MPTDDFHTAAEHTPVFVQARERYRLTYGRPFTSTQNLEQDYITLANALRAIPVETRGTKLSHEKRKNQEAIRNLTAEGIRRFPENPKIHAAYAKALYALRDFEGAYTAFCKLVRLSNSDEARSLLIRSKMEIAFATKDVDNFHDAEDLATAFLIKRNKRPGAILELLADFYQKWANTGSRMKDRDALREQALGCLIVAKQHTPNNEQGAQTLFRIAQKIQKLEELVGKDYNQEQGIRFAKRLMAGFLEKDQAEHLPKANEILDFAPKKEPYVKNLDV